MQPVSHLADTVRIAVVDQMRVDEPLHHRLGRRLRQVQHRTHHPGREVGKAEAPQPAQGQLGQRVEGTVAYRDGGPDLLVACG